MLSADTTSEDEFKRKSNAIIMASIEARSEAKRALLTYLEKEAQLQWLIWERAVKDKSLSSRKTNSILWDHNNLRGQSASIDDALNRLTRVGWRARMPTNWVEFFVAVIIGVMLDRLVG